MRQCRQTLRSGRRQQFALTRRSEIVIDCFRGRQKAIFTSNFGNTEFSVLGDVWIKQQVSNLSAVYEPMTVPRVSLISIKLLPFSFDDFEKVEFVAP